MISAVCMIGISITMAHIWAHIEFDQVKPEVIEGLDSEFLTSQIIETIKFHLMKSVM